VNILEKQLRKSKKAFLTQELLTPYRIGRLMSDRVTALSHPILSLTNKAQIITVQEVLPLQMFRQEATAAMEVAPAQATEAAAETTNEAMKERVAEEAAMEV
jgi:hypothetical protein